MEVTSGAALFFPILYFLDTSGWFAALLPAVLCHELGHWFAVRYCGGTVLSVRLDVTGICMDISPMHRTWEDVLCAGAGPFAGLCWVPLALCIGGDWGEKSAVSALIINCFNLLPALPLDGGKILLALTGSRGLLLCTSLLTAGSLIFISVYMRLWGILIPAGLIARTALTA